MTYSSDNDGDDQQRRAPPTEFAWARGRLFDEAACFALYSMAVEAGQGVVVDIRTE